MILIIIVCLISVLLMAKVLSYFIYRNKFEITIKGRVLSVDEQNFLKSLERALSDRYYIFAKVPLSDVVVFNKSANAINKRVIGKKMDGLYADFVLCKKSDMSVLGVIELEKFDKYTSLKQKEKREKLLSSVCRAIDIRLFYFDGRQDYTKMDLCRLITGRSKSKENRGGIQVNAEASMMSVEHGDSMMEMAALDKVSSCPKCYSKVVVKVATKGDQIGEKFLMCRKYPYCDYQLPIKGAVVQEIQDKEDSRRRKAGFKNW